MLFAACCETGIFSRYIDFIYTSIYYYLLFCESPVLRNAGDFFYKNPCRFSVSMSPFDMLSLSRLV